MIFGQTSKLYIRESSTGLAGAVSEYVVANQPAPVEMIGVQDRFGESGGSDELLQIMGLKSSDIVDAVKRVIARK